MASSRRRRRVGPFLFGAALVVLTSLTVHWIVLIWRHESTAVGAREAALEEAALREARMLGAQEAPPPIGPLSHRRDLEVVRVDPGIPGRVASLSPRHTGLAVRPSPGAVERLRERRRRRTAMILGEGALAALLFGVLCVMLLRWLALERQRRREIEAFIASVSHELKTPLAGIKALLGTLEMGNVPPDRLPEYLDMGLREADRLEHLVENLLIANRIRRSVLQVRLEDVDLAEFLAEFRRHREALMPEGHAGLRIDEETARGVGVRADRDKLRVVLENLTDNAIKYGADTEVRIGVRPGDQLVRLDVEDDGVGFEPDAAAGLFEGVRENTGSGGALVHGTGLGLGIARDLARAMEGELTAHSEGRDRGSRFTLALPLGEAGAPAPADAGEGDP